MVSMITLPSFAQATQIYGVTFKLLQSKMGIRVNGFECMKGAGVILGV